MNQPTDPAAHSTAGLLRRPGRALWLPALLLIVGVPLVALAVALSEVAALVPQTPDVHDIRAKAKAEHPTVALTADGQQLVTFRRLDRQWVKLADISPNVVHALLATEDRRFYEHKGMDVRRTFAAALHTLTGDREGGSTITQQLARNLYPDQIGRAPTLTRKIKEAITALKIERVATKDEILEIYLNTVPFLYNAHGIEIAARTYFDKPARDLNLLESATLIGMLKGTSYYNPVLNPERSLQRRNTVLTQMVRAEELAPAEFERIKDQPLGLNFVRQQEDLGPAPHLAQQLRRWLVDWGERNGRDIYSDGLVVRTTIDSRLQQLATQALTRQADRLQAIATAAWKPAANKQLLQVFLRETPRYKAERNAGASDADALKKLQADSAFVQAVWQDKTRLQAGFMALDPTTGQVKAWVGSRDFHQDQFDHVDQARRQPGSTFKPFVYGAAFEQGMSPDQVFIDAPVEIPLDNGQVWAPTDIEPASNQPTSVRDGLVHSKNTITSQVMRQVGPARVAQLARAMGVRQSRLDPVPSLALGTSPVTLQEMVASYGTIANGGNYIEPSVIARIETREGTVLARFQPAPERELSTAAAQTLLDVMRGVIDRGTGAGIRRHFKLKGDLAGKTGTTQDYTDGWFILMHPQLVGGAWVGFNDNRVTMRNDSWGQGARNALYIVGDFFQQAQKDRLVDAKATFAAPHLRPVPIQPPAPAPVPVPGGNDWMAGFGSTVPQEAQVVVDPRTGLVEPVPAHPVLTIPAPAVAADRPRRVTGTMSGPPAQRGSEFEWSQDRATRVPTEDAMAAELRRRANAEAAMAAQERRRAQTEAALAVARDPRAGATERPAAVILSPPVVAPRTDRPVGVIIPRPDGDQRRAPSVVEYAPQAARVAPAPAAPLWTDGSLQ